jgi:hypothetical protein
MCRIIPDGQVPYWTGTHGGMISSDLHGAEESTRWLLRPQQVAEIGHRVFTRKEDVPPEASWQRLTQGGCALSTGTFWEAVVACVEAWRGPRRANVLLQEANVALKGANVTLERAQRLCFCLIRV